MPSVNFNLPSQGLVSDPHPALTVTNAKGVGVEIRATMPAPTFPPGFTVPLVALGTKLPTALLWSRSSQAAVAVAANASAILAGGATDLGAVVGIDQAPSADPSASGGYGVLGVNERFAGIGAAGIAEKERGVGALGSGLNDGTGIVGLGYHAGVHGVALEGCGVEGFAGGDGQAGVLGVFNGQNAAGAGVRGMSNIGPGVAGEGGAGPGVTATSQQAQGLIAQATSASAPSVEAIHDSGVAISATSQSGIGVQIAGWSGTGVKIDNQTGTALDATVSFATAPAAKIESFASSALDANTLGGDFAIRGIGAATTGIVGFTMGAADPADLQKGAGVFGGSMVGAGVCGMTVSGGAGVKGVAIPGLGWAGYFDGDIFVTGVVWKAASFFSIDHPLDPQRKRLNHAAVEAPELKTLQDGVVTLDAKGRARVRLPNWFEPLNQDLRYQLTPVGAAAPDLHIAREFANGAFEIAGGKPRQKICWQVTGRRRDAWALAHPLKVEQSKRSLPETPSHVNVGSQLEKLKALAEDLQARRPKRGRDARPSVRRPPEPTTTRPSLAELATPAKQAAADALAALREIAEVLPKPGEQDS